MHFYQLRRSILTGLFISTGYLFSNAQAVINLEPEIPAPVAALSQQPGLKSWYDKPSKTLCCMYNDQKAVYIQLAITDLLQQKKVIENGIELWIDSKGKKKKHTGLLFPLPASQPAAGHFPAPDDDQVFTPPTPSNRPNEKAIRQQLKVQAMQQHEMKVIGFIDELNGTQNAKHSSGLQASLQFNNDTLIYQAVIPFQAMAKPVPNNTALTIGIIAKGMLPGNFGGNGMPDFDGPPDGMMPPPGPPPGEGEDDEAPIQQLWKDDLIWYRYVVRE